MRACDLLMQESAACRGPRRPRVIAFWLGIGLLSLSCLLPASCAPIRRLVVGDLTGEGGQGGAPGPMCQSAGGPCVSAADCCDLSCFAGACQSACISDGEACEQSAECCSGRCDQGTCAVLSTTCRTAGNACTAAAECCSGLCAADGHCSLGSSYCVQPEDVCAAADDCCTGVCDIELGASLGVCAQAPSGASNCSGGLAGLLCSDCKTCCSRLCAPYGESGVSICMPAPGCKVTGELCTSDADCCGGDAEGGLPGAGNASCDIADGAEVGVCRNAMGCSPQGNVCHLQDYACSVSAASNRCCDGSAAGSCELDPAGMPRCSGLGDACQPVGEACASSVDCCGEATCTPDGAGHLRCREAP